jgi:serpin B
MSQESVRGAAGTLLGALAGSPRTARFDVGTALWTREQAPLRPAFVQQVQRAYRAKVQTLDFAAPDAPAVINRWVRTVTHGKISAVVRTIPREAIAYLVNAVYFQGQWRSPFIPENTHTQAFQAASGRRLSVRMMRQTAVVPYVQERDVQLVSLPYGEQPRFSMVVLLPRPGLALASLVDRLTPATWQAWMAHLHPEAWQQRSRTRPISPACARRPAGCPMSATRPSSTSTRKARSRRA